jgi:hypothetical protein
MFELKRSTMARVLSALAQVAALSACGHDAENAAQSARIATLEDDVKRLRDNLNALNSGATGKPATPPTAANNKPFSIECPQPWLLHTPLGATLWSCRSPTATPDGFYPQCSIVEQPQSSIELLNYFEFATNASPQLRQVKNLKDKPIKIKDRDGFEGVYEADPKPVPLKMRSVLIPHREQVYAVTCFAPASSCDSFHAKALQKITSSITFPEAQPNKP